MDHEYQSVFYHSAAHRSIECPVLERRALLPRLPTECYFAPELFRETRNKPQRGSPAFRRWVSTIPISAASRLQSPPIVESWLAGQALSGEQRLRHKPTEHPRP